MLGCSNGQYFITGLERAVLVSNKDWSVHTECREQLRVKNVFSILTANNI